MQLLVDTDDEIIAIINASPSTYVDVAAGGTGVGTFTDHGVLVGSGAADITALAAMTDGQLLIGDTDEDPVLATLTGTANEITVTGGAGSITLSIPDSAVFVTPSMNDGNVTNVADIALDSISADTDNGVINVGDRADLPIINVDGSPAANSTYSGVVITGINAGEAVTQNQLVFMASDGKWDVADANDAGHFPAIGMAVAEHGDGWPAADGDELSVLTMGVVRYDAWAWTDEGVVLYLDDTTAGSMIEAAGIPSDDGDCVQVIGRVLDSTAGSGTNDSVYIDPSMDWFLDDGT